MEQNEPRKCDGKCQNCTLLQQTYCSAARLYAFMQHEPTLFSKIEKMEESLSSIERRLAQFGEPANNIAPIGPGAENTVPESQNKFQYGL